MDYYVTMLLILCGTITVLGAHPGHEQEEVYKRVESEC